MQQKHHQVGGWNPLSVQESSKPGLNAETSTIADRIFAAASSACSLVAGKPRLYRVHGPEPASGSEEGCSCLPPGHGKQSF
jgi:hypothetical protein